MTARTAWQDAPWGRLRYTLAEANLLRHLAESGDAPLRVLDLGGGDGGDAVRLAARGHHVTIVDNASAMLSAAAERADATGLAELITFVHADVDTLPAAIVDTRFDVVVCHNLIQYAVDARHRLAAALAPLRPGGLFSVMAINRHSAPLVTAVRELDLPAAMSALETDPARTTTFGSRITLHTAEDVGSHLLDLGCDDIHHYGIRTVCDYITDDERQHDPTFHDELERLELALTARHPYMHTARLFQLTARKSGM